MNAEVTLSDEEYSSRKLKTAVFVPESSAAVKYGLSQTFSEDLLLYGKRFHNYSPLLMYKVRTDALGDVCGLEEIDEMYYGKYDFGSEEQDISFKEDKFIYNGTRYRLAEELESQAKEVKECTQVGNKIVVKGEIIPGEYEFFIFDIYTQWFENRFTANDFVWYGDNVYMSFYVKDGTVFDYGGNSIADIGSDYSSIDFKDENSIEVWRNDGNGYSSDMIEFYGSSDLPYYAYMEYYNCQTPSAWRNFMSYAPENSTLFIITDPDEEMVYYEDDTGTEEGTADDPEKGAVIAVPLCDGASVRLDTGTYVIDDAIGHRWEETEQGTEYQAGKGEPVCFGVTLAEGIPSSYIYMYNDRLSAEWPAEEISGMHPCRCTFVQSFGSG